jgi:hypothetical protein
MSVAEPHAERAGDFRRPASPEPGRASAVSIEGILAVMRHPLMVAFLSVAALIQVYRVGMALPGRIHEEDFADYYAAATIMRQGENPYRTSLGTVGPRLGLHSKGHHGDDTIPETPAFLLGLKALGALPLTQAYWTWIAINFAALLASFYLLLGPGSGLRPVDAWLMAALALIYPPTIQLFMTAQSQALVILAFALTTRWLAEGHDAAAGLMLAAAAVLRGYPALLGLYLLFMRKGRALAFMIAGGVVGLIACMILMGWRVVLDFPLGLAAAAGDRTLFRVAFNLSPRSFVWRLFYYLNGLHLSPAGDRLATAAGYGASMAFLAFTVRATLQHKPGADRDWRFFSLWVVTSIMVLPFAWLNYATMLFVAFALLAAAGVRNRASARAKYAAMVSYFLSLFAFGGLLFLKPNFPIICFVLVGESKSAALMAGYLSAYWFAVDET